MAKDWFKRIFFILFKSAALVAVVLAGIHFKNARVGEFSPGVAIDNSVEIGRRIFEVKKNLESNFPAAEGETERTYRWNYGGKSYSVSQTLYSSIYEFYKAQPKTYTYFNELPENWEEEYYGMFIGATGDDSYVSDLTDVIVSQGEKNGLDQDQIAELVLAFVQSIPYDDQKAANILARTGNETMDYPYETLFENGGVCSDKSFLATVLLRKLGYGTALFVFENENHMAIGIQCPKEYSDYDSGYCFAETTSVGNKIGIVPDLKASVGSAVGTEQIAYFDEGATLESPSVKLTDVKIFQKTQGMEYRGIIQTVKINAEISALKKEIAVLTAELKELKSEINEAESYLADKKKSLDKYLKNDDIKKYNEQAEKYNEVLADYEDKVKIYNKKVGSFNAKVTRYNTLIKL